MPLMLLASTDHNIDLLVPNMPMCLLVYGAVVCALLTVGSMGEKMLGSGEWTVLNVQRCENDGEMPWRLLVRRHRLNRTHDAFDVDLELTEDLDDSCAMRLVICKMMDGGCKPYMNMDDDCFPKFVKKHAADNVKAVLASAGIDPPDFPIAKGEYHIKNFMVNNDDLPDGVYGEFGVHGYIMKNGADMACCKASLEYTPKDDYGPNPTPFG